MDKAFEKIVERFKNHIKLMKDNAEKYDYDKGSVEAYKNAINIVQEVAAEYNNSWIEYSELDFDTHPKERGYYLCSVGDKVKISYYFPYNPFWAEYVTAWMPLPDVEPYKKVKKELTESQGIISSAAAENFMNRFMMRE